MIRLPKPLQTTLVVMAALATGYGAAIWHSQSVVPPVEAADTKPAADVVHSLLDEVAERVRSEYVDNVVPTKLEQAAIVGMVSSLDPHSALLDADAYDEMRINTAGSYTGLGIEIAADQDRIVVVTPIEGSPAATAGVRSGDVILSIDGQPVSAEAPRPRPSCACAGGPDRACGSRSAAVANPSRCSSISSAPRFTCAP